MSITILVATIVLAGSAVFSVIMAKRTADSAKKSIRLKAISELDVHAFHAYLPVSPEHPCQ